MDPHQLDINTHKILSFGRCQKLFQKLITQCEVYNLVNDNSCFAHKISSIDAVANLSG
jgi:hypothetical protein